MNFPKIALIAGMGVFGLIAGRYGAGLMGSDSGTRSAARAPASAVPPDDSGTASSEAPSGEDAPQVRPGKAVSADPEFTGIVSRLGIEKDFARMRSFFPDTEKGHELARLAVLSGELSNVGSPEGNYGNRMVENLIAGSQETMDAMRAGLDKMPEGEFPEERQFLLQFTSQLDLQEREKVDFLMEQAEKPVHERGGTAFFNVSAAFEGIIASTEGKPRETEDALNELLSHHSADREVQKLLVFSFARVNPERAVQLREQYGL